MLVVYGQYHLTTYLQMLLALDECVSNSLCFPVSIHGFACGGCVSTARAESRQGRGASRDRVHIVRAKTSRIQKSHTFANSRRTVVTSLVNCAVSTELFSVALMFTTAIQRSKSVSEANMSEMERALFTARVRVACSESINLVSESLSALRALAQQPAV